MIADIITLSREKRSLPKTYRRISVCLMVVLLVFVVTACGKSAKSESAIKDDILSDTDFLPSSDLIIDEIEIIKRQTNKDDKTDIVYVTLDANNDDVECRLSYVLKYRLYNDGWDLDSISPYQYDEWEIIPLHGPTQEQADAKAEEKGSSEISYVCTGNTVDIDAKTATFYYRGLERECDYASKYDLLEVSFSFSYSTLQWEYAYYSTDIEYEWHASGTYEGDSYYAEGWEYFQANISQVDNDTLHITVYCTQTNETCLDQDVSVGEMNNGTPVFTTSDFSFTSFDFISGGHTWTFSTRYSLAVCITPYTIYIGYSQYIPELTMFSGDDYAEMHPI